MKNYLNEPKATTMQRKKTYKDDNKNTQNINIHNSANNSKHIQKLELSNQKKIIYIIISFSITEACLNAVLNLNEMNNENMDMYNLTLIIQIIGSVMMCISLAFLYYMKNKYNSINNKMMNTMYTVLLLTLIFFDLPSFIITSDNNYNIPMILRLSTYGSLFTGLKLSWKIYAGTILLNTILCQFIYIVLGLVLLIIHIGLFFDRSVLYGLITLEFIIFMLILYFQQKNLKSVTQKKLNSIKHDDNSFIKFMLNEISDNIIIMNYELKIKFANMNFLNNQTKYNNNIASNNDNNNDNNDYQYIMNVFKHIKEIKNAHDHLKKSEFILDGDSSKADIILQHNSNEEPCLTTTLTNFRNTLFTNTNINHHQNSSMNNHSLYDLLIGTDGKIKFYELMKSKKKDSFKFTIAFDCKYIKPETQEKKSLELKISLMTFQEEECLIFLFKDITDREIISKLEDNNTYKERLLASVTHELRTPLNGNLVMLESALQDCNITESIKNKYLEPAYRSGKFLMNIINDILDYSQINANSIRIIYKQDFIRKTINECISLIEMQAVKKGIEIMMDIDENVPAIFCTDHNRLIQIILNLVSNSLKFTFKGYIKISAKMFMNQKLLKISVEDTGIGIQQENLKELFKPFTRINLGKKSQLNANGIGLGLSISKTLSKLLGPNDGDGLEVTSTYGVGTIFSFILEQREPTFETPLLKLTSSSVNASKKIISNKSNEINNILNNMSHNNNNEMLSLSSDRLLDIGDTKVAITCMGNYYFFNQADSQEKAIYDLALANNYININTNYHNNENDDDNDNNHDNRSQGDIDKKDNNIIINNQLNTPKKPDIEIMSFLTITDKSPLIQEITSETKGNNVIIPRPKPKVIFPAKTFGSIKDVTFKDNPTINIFDSNDNENCTCPKILVVDDDAFNVMALENLLQKYKKTFVTAYNGQSAIDRVLEREEKSCSEYCKPFEMIFMDCNMPIMDGFEATKILKTMVNEKKIRPIMIIGCTSYSTKEKTEECLKAGMDDVISKPLSSSKLHETFEHINNFKTLLRART